MTRSVGLFTGFILTLFSRVRVFYRIRFSRWVRRVLRDAGIQNLVGWPPSGSTAQWVREGIRQGLDAKAAACAAVVGTARLKAEAGELSEAEAHRVVTSAHKLLTDIAKEQALEMIRDAAKGG